MKNLLSSILNKYLEIFPEEYERQSMLIKFLNLCDDDELIDWNNFKGHVVASGFIYSKKDDKFLVLYHKDLKMYLYPGGHVDSSDINLIDAARREVREETGLKDIEQYVIEDEEMLPIDIDTHIIGYNERLNLSEHYHFDFRYLFMIDEIGDVNIDGDELGDYKWIGIEELEDDSNYGKVALKIRNLLFIIK